MPLYRLAVTLLAPFLIGLALWRVLRGGMSRTDLAERLGAGAGTPGAIWLHGASNGELASARRLIEALRAGIPDRPLIVTCNTVTGRDLVRGWALPGVTARLAPVDLRWALARFRAQWRPAALVVLENEIWPNRIVTARGPVIVVAARMSEKTYRAWRWFGGLARRVLPHIDRLYPQDARSGERLRALGLPPDRLGEVAQLKSGVAQAPPGPATLTAFRAHFPRPATLLAASTHPGEEEIVLDAFARARDARPDLRLILAPRHPGRRDEIRALIAATGLPFAQRTEVPEPPPDCAIYLADTLGEMPLWYSLAGVTIVGGSFTDRGGHTPFEPAQFGSAVIHGPDVANFADAYAVLHQAEAAIEAADAPGLARAIAALATAEAQEAQAARARKTLAALDDSAAVIGRIVADLKDRLPG